MVLGQVEGMVMEKVTTERDGKDEDKLQLRIFQRGNKDLVTATVSTKTFSAIKEGDKINLKAKIDIWRNDGSSGLYCIETF